jgi:hypothetical protein
MQQRRASRGGWWWRPNLKAQRFTLQLKEESMANKKNSLGRAAGKPPVPGIVVVPGSGLSLA